MARHPRPNSFVRVVQGLLLGSAQDWDRSIALLRLRWLEGKIGLALGDLRRAEALFLEVREELARHGLGHAAALLLLDLARVYVQEKRSGDLQRIATEMLAIFRSRQLPGEALAALILFGQAAEMEGITLALIQELSDTLPGGQTSGMLVPSSLK